MKRVNYHLPESTISILKNISKQAGLSVAELIRISIDAFLEKQQKEEQIMIYIEKETRDKCIAELNKRMSSLAEILENALKLDSNQDGFEQRNKGKTFNHVLSWNNTNAMCKLNEIDLQLAVNDFKAILTTITKLKSSKDY